MQSKVSHDQRLNSRQAHNMGPRTGGQGKRQLRHLKFSYDSQCQELAVRMVWERQMKKTNVSMILRHRRSAAEQKLNSWRRMAVRSVYQKQRSRWGNLPFRSTADAIVSRNLSRKYHPALGWMCSAYGVSTAECWKWRTKTLGGFAQPDTLL